MLKSKLLFPFCVFQLHGRRKRQPISVNLKRKDLKAELERAIESTYMHQNKGTCTYVDTIMLIYSAAE